METIQRLAEFIAASPSAFHAASNARDELVAAGFSEGQDVTAPGGHVMVSGGAVIAWFVPDNPRPGFKIIGSHTDSPGLMLKPEMELTREGMRQLAVEVYGGPILASWFDRELTVAGRVVLDNSAEKLVNTGAVATLPNLAIHLTRRDGNETLDRQAHTQPLVMVDKPVREIIADAAGVDPGRILSHELICAPAQPGEITGEMFASGRLDNLTSVRASISAMLRAVERGPDRVLVLAAFNHEEVGSASVTGAGGPLLERVLTSIAGDDAFDVFAQSSMISADAAHSVHPNYPERHDPTHRPKLGEGPVLKINANQRYASDAATEALWLRACADAGVPTQTFVGNNSMPCGSTIGPIASTRLGIPTVDAGVPILAMHSARELMNTRDQMWFEDALTAYFVGQQ